jgi:lysophospholipase L1-like esterase
MGLLAACGSPTHPTQIPAITLTCPADIQIGSVTTPTALVPFALPTATGGKPPITVTCSPAANSAFALGATPVTCTGTDGTRSAMCTFNVTLIPPQAVLSVSHVLAFGDSITAGENGEDAPAFIDQPHSYAWLLFDLLVARYTTQSPRVTDCGKPGELVPDGASRIDGVLDSYKPDVLTLLEGINDVGHNNDLDGTEHTSTDDGEIIDGLTHDIEAAKARGLAGIFVSTILPESPSNCVNSPLCRVHDEDELEPINATIRGLVAREGVILVDNYAAMLGHPEYLDTDGLHPNPAGNQVVAQNFFAAIQAKFETLQPTRTGTRTTLDVPVDSQSCFDVPAAASIPSRRRIR